MIFDESIKLLEKSKTLIPGLTQTFSRSATTFVEGCYPVYAKSAKGSHFFDVDNNEFIDYLMALGPITLGYNYSSVNQAVMEQLQDGVLFSLPHPIEIQVSELISEIIPNAEMVKFEKSGSNAVTGAVRAARALTKREKIAYCGSGGVWHDWQAAMVSRNDGVPKFNQDLIKIFDYNDASGLEQIFHENPNEIATVVLEPTYLEKPKNDFLQQVRKLTNENKSILILDEIVTGFRFDLQGGQKYFDIEGDFVCYGKGIANGFPLSIIAGKSEFMKIFDKLWVSSTNNSETLSLAACNATLNEMKNNNTLDYCWSLGKKLFNGWNKIVENYDLDAKMMGYDIRMALKCYDSQKNESNSLKALILQEMIKKGIFISPGHTFISYSHSELDISNTLSSLEDICDMISKKVKDDNFKEFVEGNLPQSIWNVVIESTKKKTL
ncbi:aminotransferase class III-fold pyridoxal phosphate-dependent enzyme [Nitrosopumilus sp.]|uniref:aminotransferase class III-fold pyridoxal phosphate-dependent enzyme n=1 Tax=Nitrosopumilus sp. TaxID=2024843 RepID=UPI00247C6329|nr:aminotransferase class III-fold pyridoxal phosphate-dependent enzyme [Nitrosopumilus sp.]MCV0430383.1 aminotransferase class III-fold pyridoxal phosphate-dependent enzyme [Nitrosopumilus sp.]